MKDLSKMLEELSDEDLFDVIDEYLKIEDNENDSDYEIDAVQFEKLMAIIQMFYKLKDTQEVDIEIIKLSPKHKHGYFNATVNGLNLFGDEIGKFFDIFKGASGLSIEPTLKGNMIISGTVPYVFKKKG